MIYVLMPFCVYLLTRIAYLKWEIEQLNKYIQTLPKPKRQRKETK